LERNRSMNSFAVSLCVASHPRGDLVEALYKRLRLVEQNRMPLFGRTALRAVSCSPFWMNLIRFFEQ